MSQSTVDDTNRNTNENQGGGLPTIAKILLWTGAAIGATAIANAYIAHSTPPLISSLEGGEIRYFATPDGDIFYKKAGDGPPLLLIHGIGAGCSSYEFRNIFASLSEQYTVYALDLLGFGKSDRPTGIDYSAEKYIAQIDDFCRTVIGAGGGNGETDVIATSLSAAYVIALSQRDPSIFRRLVLVVPTGIEELADKPALGSAIANGVLKTPVLGESIYNGIASRAGIRWYMTKNLFAQSAKVTDAMVEQYYIAAHQPGGGVAISDFISGNLNIDIREAFGGVVDLPLIVWGRQAQESPLELSEAFLHANPHAKLEVIEDAGMLPHDEQPEAFLAAVRPFLAAADDAPAETGNNLL